MELRKNKKQKRVGQFLVVNLREEDLKATIKRRMMAAKSEIVHSSEG